MTENEFLLEDRLQKIRDTVAKYGEKEFYLSYSGGKDSSVVDVLLDMAVPGNRIPRVFCNTGIEYRAMVEFVRKRAAHDERIEIIQPGVNIKKMLDTEGYPFKSKRHSQYLGIYQRHGISSKTVRCYLDDVPQGGRGSLCCPKVLRYQFTSEFTLKVSDKCCANLKERPLREYMKIQKKTVNITGIVAAEGGRRESAKCLSAISKKYINFNPLAPLPLDWIEWFVDAYAVELCELYKEPYNFQRTGCKGCPFSINLQEQLDKMQELMPNEAKQCELIWAPVYAEYRRIGYRLRQDDNIPGQMTLEEVMG